MTAMGVDRAKKRHSTNVTDARRRALVTGGSRGIGLAVCKELASRGHAVSFVYRSNEAAARDACVELESLGVPVLGIRSDLSVAKQASAAVAQAWDAWGGFDVLVHSAGAPAPWKPLRDLEAEEWSRFVGTDLGGFFNVLSPTLLRMHERRGLRRCNLINCRPGVPGSCRRRGGCQSRPRSPGARCGPRRGPRRDPGQRRRSRPDGYGNGRRGDSPMGRRYRKAGC